MLSLSCFFAVLVSLPTSLLTLYLHPRVFFWKHKASQMQGLRPYTESRVVIAGVESIESRALGGSPLKPSLNVVQLKVVVTWSVAERASEPE